MFSWSGGHETGSSMNKTSSSPELLRQRYGQPALGLADREVRFDLRSEDARQRPSSSGWRGLAPPAGAPQLPPLSRPPPPSFVQSAAQRTSHSPPEPRSSAWHGVADSASSELAQALLEQKEMMRQQQDMMRQQQAMMVQQLELLRKLDSHAAESSTTRGLSKAPRKRKICRKPSAQKAPIAQTWAKSASCRPNTRDLQQWPLGEPDNWTFDGRDGFEIAIASSNTTAPIEVPTKAEAIQMVRSSPNLYFGCDWVQPGYVGNARVYPRSCVFYGSGFMQNQNQPDATGAMRADYQMLQRNVRVDPDEYTDSRLSRYQGRRYSAKSPGRGQGLLDRPGLKVMETVNPQDVAQGGVGDCWLLSAISALAEFDDAVRKLFKGRRDLHLPPPDGFSKYTITLYDLKTWKPVDVVVDERLIWDDNQGGLLGCRPVGEGELWPCLLEKAVAAHCGGWDNIDGGTCAHAWRILTGCKEVYTIEEGNGGYRCFGAFNPNQNRWEDLANSPHEGFQGLWPMKWPEVGGGGDLDRSFSQDELFAKMCAWNAANFIMGAGSRSGSDTEKTDGIVDGHAYSVLDCIKNAGGAGFDMVRMRNPWGHQEFECGGWTDNGPNWKRYPEVYEACGKPVAKDDGIFWMTKENFFFHFKKIYLCAQDMAHFVTHPKSASHGVQPSHKTKPPDVKEQPSKWHFDARDGYEIALSSGNKTDPIEVDTKEEALKMVRESPKLFFGCEWVQPGYCGKARVYPRTCEFYGPGFLPNERQPDAVGAVKATYQMLPRNVQVDPDNYTDMCLARYQGRAYSSKSPGRGQGLMDKPGLKVMRDINPRDVDQGGVGDCWLLSAISALAEFDDAVLTLFKGRRDLHLPPSDSFNKYTIRLYDLKTWDPVDVVVDERLIWDDDQGSLLGCRPSEEGEIWPCLLEKAVAAHCGGWDKIDGGTCAHAWRILTGCKHVYSIEQGDNGYACYGAYNPNEERWEQLANSPHEGFQGLWPMKWPDVGGGGGIGQGFDQDALFAKMCAWDAANFIMGAGSQSGSDTEKTDGIVDGHAYSILTCIQNAGGSGFDMVKMRNPWGSQEFERGGWTDDGPNWKKYPEVYEACGKPVPRDDGIFWMQKETFFQYFTKVYLCAHDMAKFASP
eukprot:TRINITY_DN20018_c0_g3_i1.p1 TRINITY_DN20018_c0_g3~~TRINITY_DN20018_c0_g3_i1.p1  ORF type:complete len:1129 (-),score=112.23 TRINITY_DN20018_c0_g3_i1:184-3570(-)